MNPEYDEDGDDDLRFIATHLVSITRSSVRHSKGALRIDPNKVKCNDFDIQEDRIDDTNSRMPYHDQYLHEPDTDIQNFENTSIVSSESSDDAIDDIDGIKIRTGDRTKSMEDLISTMKIDDNERLHFLDNFKLILNHESRHLILLNAINKYKATLQDSKISDDIISSIFYNIDDLISAQNRLVECLETMIGDWDLNKHLFIEMMDLYELIHMRCKKYVKNLSHAITELRLFFERNNKFFVTMHMVLFEGAPIRFEVLLAKPTNWLYNSLENIKSIIETAEGQCDVKMIREILEKLKDNSINKVPTINSFMEKNVLIRSGIVIEILPNDQRRMMHLFLFSGMLVCTHHRHLADGTNCSKMPPDLGSPNKLNFEFRSIERRETKWFILLQNLVINQTNILENCDKSRTEISNLKDKIRDLRIQLISEKTKVSESFSLRNVIVKKDIDRLQNQINKALKDLMRLSPTISFVIGNLAEKPHHLLLFSIKELEFWKRDIFEAKKDLNNVDISNISLTTVSKFMESHREDSSLIEADTVPLLRNINNEGVTGVAVINIETVTGLNPLYSYYMSVEVDSFNINELQARTKLRSNDSSLSWNECFDIELDCSHTMNILLYEVKSYKEDKESLLGYFEFNLDMEDFDNKTVTKSTQAFGENSVLLQIQVSFKIKTGQDLMKRSPSLTKTELFGVSLESVVAREKARCNQTIENVPIILYVCFKRIEEKGLDEEGIYRISGNKNDITEFYKRLNKNVVNSLKDIGNFDLHTITSVVKLYLRELPEPLMLSENYLTLLNISNMIDEVDRYHGYSEVIHHLPEPNRSTVIHIFKHLKRVVEHSNKNHMIASNLGLIIGPTMILPPSTPDKESPSNFARETMASISVSRVFTQLMNGICCGAVHLDPLPAGCGD